MVLDRQGSHTPGGPNRENQSNQDANLQSTLLCAHLDGATNCAQLQTHAPFKGLCCCCAFEHCFVKSGVGQFGYDLLKASALYWYSCHPLSALMGQLLEGCSTLSRSLTTLIMVPATEMSIQALSSKHSILASQMESLITPCAAKCSIGPQFW